MNAAVVRGIGEVAVESVEDARIEAPAAFRRFDRREDGYIKVILDPAGS